MSLFPLTKCLKQNSKNATEIKGNQIHDRRLDLLNNDFAQQD